jgi:hypothetical protein
LCFSANRELCAWNRCLLRRTSFFVTDRFMTASLRCFGKCKLRKSLHGSIRSGTIGCSIPLGYWPQLDQGGFGPTTSRVTGEVTLPFHHVQPRLPFREFCDAILCVDNFKPGGINEHSYGADGPAIVVIEVSLLCTIPVSSAAGTLGPSVFRFALPLSYSSFRRWRNLNPHPVVRCNSDLRHAANFSISDTPPAHAPRCVFHGQ